MLHSQWFSSGNPSAPNQTAGWQACGGSKRNQAEKIRNTKWFQNKGQFKDESYVPAVGDIIFFDWGNDGSINQVGIVESVSKGTVHTIEGNSGDAMRKRSYPVGDSRIYGYGVYVQ